METVEQAGIEAAAVRLPPRSDGRNGASSSDKLPSRIDSIWPLWQRVLFRFFFVYLLLQIAPWNWFYRIPGAGALNGYIFNATDPDTWPVRTSR